MKCAFLNALMLAGAVAFAPMSAKADTITERQVIDSTTELSNVVAQGIESVGSFGGAIYNSSGLTLSGTSNFTGNSATNGGAIYSTGTLTANGTFKGNNATGPADWDNNAQGAGGAIYNTGTLTVGGTFGGEDATDGNTALQGGAIFNEGGDLTVSANSVFQNNKAEGATNGSFGGAIFNDHPGSKLTIGDGTQFISNTAASGAAIYSEGLTESQNIVLVGDNVVFKNNISNNTDGSSAAVYLFGNNSLTIGDNVLFQGNEGSYTGASIFMIDGAPFDTPNGKVTGTIGDNATFKNNTAGWSGAAVYLNTKGNTLSIGNGATFENNTGNAIWTGGAITIGTGATFTGNTATATGAYQNGGAIVVRNNGGVLDGSITIGDGATFTDNTAGGLGGAIYNEGTVNISGAATFSGNTDSTGANDIYNTGTVNFTAGSEKTISLAAGISGDAGNKGTVNKDGLGVLAIGDADHTGATIENQNVTVAAGELHLTTAATDGSNLAGSTVSVNSSAIINTIDNVINDYTGTITLANGAIIKGDIDYIAGTADTYAAADNANITYKLANALGESDILTGDTKNIQVAVGTNVTVNKDASFAWYNSDRGLTLEGGDDGTGTVKVTGVAGGINGAVDNTTDTGTPKNVIYTVTSDETFDGADNVIANSNFTINGQGTDGTDPAITLDTDMIIGDATKPSTLNLNDAKLIGEHALQNTAGSTLNINDSLIDVLVKNYGTLTSDPTTYKGGIENYEGASVAILGDTFENINRAGKSGGAIWNESTGLLTLDSTNFTSNTAANGGAIYNKGTTTIDDGAFTGNTATAAGGAIYNTGSLSIIDAQFTGNTAGTQGGAIYSTANVSIAASSSKVAFTGNMANGVGNDIYMAGASGSPITLSLKAKDDTKDLKLGYGVDGQYYNIDINNGGTATSTVALGTVTGATNVTVNTGIVSATALTADKLDISAGSFSSTDGITVNQGTNAGKIAGTGTLNIGNTTASSTYTNNGLISTAIDIKSKGTLTTAGVDSTSSPTVGFSGAVDNAGILDVTAGTINSTVSGAGQLKTANGVDIASGKTVTQGSLDVTGTLTNAGALTVNGAITGSSTPTIIGAGNINLNGGTATDATAGNVAAINISGDVTVGGFVDSTAGSISANDVAISSGKYLKINADGLNDTNDDTIANEGTLELVGGTLGDAVSGEGHTDINSTGTVTFNALVNQDVNVLAGTLQTAAANIGDTDVNNIAQLTITGGDVGFDISQTDTTGVTTLQGTTKLTSGHTITQNTVNIAGTGAGVTNEGTIVGAVSNTAAGSILNNAGTITGSLTNSSQVANTGTISGNIVNNGTGTIETAANTIATGDTATITNDGTLTLTGGTLSKDINKVTAGNGIVDIAGDVALSATIADNTIRLTSGTLSLDGIADSTGNISLAAANGVTANGGALDVQDGKTGTINLGNVNTTAGAISVAIDADFSGGASGLADVITATVTGSNKINVSSIALTTGGDPIETEFTAQIAAAANAANVDLTATTLTGLDASAGSLLLSYNSSTGYLTGKHATLTDAIESDIATKAYNLASNVSITGPLTLDGTSLSITGNSYTISSTTLADGIDVNGKTLTINDATLTGFDTALTNASGKLTLNGVTINDSNTADVANSATGAGKGLELTGTNTIGVITGTGSTAITSGTSTVTSLAQADLSVAAGAGLNIAADNLSVTNGVDNAGTVTLGAGTLASNIAGAGSTVIDGAVINSALIKNDITINSGKSLNTAGSNNTSAASATAGITGAVANASGTLTLTGGYVLGDVTGAGSTVIDGDVTNNALIENGITINSGKSLTTAGVDDTSSPTVGFSGAVDNAGILDVTAGTINSTVSGAGQLKTANGVDIASGKTVTQGSLDVTGTLTNAGTLTVNGAITGSSTPTIIGTGNINLNGGTATDDTAGNAVAIATTGTSTVTVGGFVDSTSGSISAYDVAISSDKYLKINANSLDDTHDDTIANAGTLELVGGTLSDTVSGAGGHTDITTGAVDFANTTVAINQAINITGTGSLTANGSNIGGAVANEVAEGLILTGGTLNNAVSMTGTAGSTKITTGTVTLNANVGQDINVASGTLQSVGANVGGDVAIANGATFELTGGNFAHDITGYGTTPTYGTLNVSGTSAVSGTSVVVDTLTVAAGKTLTDTSDITVNTTLNNNGTIDGTGSLNLNGAAMANDGAISITGTTTIGDGTNAASLTNNGTITGGDIVVAAKGTLTTNASNVSDKDDNISNAGTIVLTGGVLANDITNTAANSIVEIAAGAAGTVTLNDGIVDGNTGYLKLTSGTLDLQYVTGASSGNVSIDSVSGIIANGGTLSVQDNKYGAINLGNVDTEASALYVAIDMKLSQETAADVLNATSVSGSNGINISSFNITEDPDKTEFVVHVADTSISDKVSIATTTLNTSPFVLPGLGNLLLTYDAVTGDITGTHKDLYNAIESTIAQKAYAIGDGDLSGKGVVTLHGTSLSITTNDEGITGDGNKVVIDNAGQTLSIAAGTTTPATITGFAIDNSVGGTVNLTDVTMTGNATDVQNNGTGVLTLAGTNNINTIAGTGTTTVASGTTEIHTSLAQTTVNVGDAVAPSDGALVSDGTFTATTLNVATADSTFENATGGLAVITDVNNLGTVTNNDILRVTNFDNDNAVVNNGTLQVTTDFDNTGTVTNNANGVISGVAIDNNNGGTITNTGTINAAITNDAASTVTTTANGIRGGVTNDGTVELTGGDLASSIASSTGITTGHTDVTGAVTINDSTKSIGQDINITTGSLTADAASIGGTVDNSVDDGLVLTGGTLNQAVTGTGSTEVTGTVAIAAGKVLGQDIDITSGSLTANAASIGGDVDNSVVNGLDLTGGTLANDVTGTGTTNITGDVDFADTTTAIGQAMTIASTGSLTADGGNIGGAVTNNAADGLTLTGGALGQAVTGTGSTVIDGDDVTVNASLGNTGGITVLDAADSTSGNDAQLTIAANNVDAALTNNGNVVLGAGTLESAISGTGTTEITGAVVNDSTITGNDIEIAAGGSLDTDADDITDKDGTIVNDGDLTLNKGTLDQDVVNGTGAGTTHVTGKVDVVATNTITQDISVDAGELTANADSLQGDIANSVDDGLVLTGGTLSQDISGTGSTKIAGNVTTNGDDLTLQDTNIAAGSSLTIAPDTTTTPGTTTPSTVTMGETNVAAGGTLDAGINAVSVNGGDIDGSVKIEITDADRGSDVITGGSLTNTGGAGALDVTGGSLDLTITGDLLTMQHGETGDLSTLVVGATGPFATTTATGAGGDYELIQNDDGTFKIKNNDTFADIDSAAEVGSKNNVATAIGWDNALNLAEGTLGREIQKGLNAISKTDPKAYVNALTDLAPTDAQIYAGLTQDFNNQINEQVMSRLLAAQGINSGDVTLGGAWAQALYNHSKQDKAKYTPGFTGRTTGLAIGLDGEFDYKTTVGFGYAYGQTDVDSLGRDIDVDTHNFFVYGKYQPNNDYYVRGSLNYSMSDYDEKAVVLGQLKKASYDVDAISVNAYVGRALNKHLTQEAGLRFNHIMVDSYEDTAGQHVSTDDIDILTAVLGVNYAHGKVTTAGFEWTPRVHAAVTYDLLSDDTSASVRIGDSGYRISGRKLDRLGVEGGIGAEVSVDNWDFYVDYSIGYRGNYTSQTGSLNIRYNF